MVRSGQEEGAIGALLLDILIFFVRANRERVFSRTLTAELNAQGDRPWAELRRGRQATELWLARELRPYGVRPRTMWIGEEAAKGYLKEDFNEVFVRYIPRKEAKALLKELAVPAEGPGKAATD